MILQADGRKLNQVERLLAPFIAGYDCFIVKPNFFKALPGYYTDAETLDLILSLLPGSKHVIECYTAARSERCRKLSEGGGVDHRDEFRQEDEIFFQSTGIQKVLAKHDACYLNVTEEVWAGRTADSQFVRAQVKNRHASVEHQELYEYVPQRLLDLENPLFVNLAKFKIFDVGAGQPFFSLSMKNLFGLIPTPSRQIYHGKEYDGLARSITDMCAIYCSLFPMLHLLEAIHSTLFPGHNESQDALKDLGLLMASDSPVELDACAVRLAGAQPSERHFLQMGAEVFGAWDEHRFPQPPQKWQAFFARFGIPCAAPRSSD